MRTLLRGMMGWAVGVVLWVLAVWVGERVAEGQTTNPPGVVDVGGNVPTTGAFTVTGITVVGGSNAVAIGMTNDMGILPTGNTNSILVSGAGTAGANGVYDRKGHVGAIDLYTNRVGVYGLALDPDSEINVDYSMLITNVSGTLLYGVNSGVDPNVTWAVASGTGPAPTVAWANVTNYAGYVLVSGTGMPFPLWSTKDIWVNGQVGKDDFGRIGRIDRPFATLTNALRAAVSNSVVRVAPGTQWCGGGLSVPNNVTVEGAGRGVTWLLKDPSFNGSADKAINITNRCILRGWSGNVTPNVLGRDNLIENIETDCVIDNLLLQATSSNTVVRKATFIVSGADGSAGALLDACVVNCYPTNTAFLYDTDFISVKNVESASERRGIAMKSGHLVVSGGAIRVKDANGGAYGIDVNTASDNLVTLEVGNVTFDVSTTNGLACAITNSSAHPGVVTIEGFSPSRLVGAFSVRATGYGTNLLWTTNGTAPGNTGTVRVWYNATNADGVVFKVPGYQ